MKSQVQVEKYDFKYWDRAKGACYDEGKSPSETGTVTQTWSNDLEISFNNGERSRRTKLNAKLEVIPGAPFRVVKRDYTHWSTLGEGLHLFENDYGTCHSALLGPQFARYSSFSNTAFPASSASSFATLESLGRKAISMVAPTGSAFSASQFLGELREGLPGVSSLAISSQERVARAKAAGGSYLNTEFGWKPLVSDIAGFVNTVENSNAILDNYYRMSQRILKRNYSFPETFTTSVVDSGTGYYPMPNRSDSWMFSASGRRVTTSVMKQRRWFEGAFIYVLPPFDSFRRKYSGFRKLFGVELTPELLYELAPWSWAADWITDAGTLAKNLSLFSKDSLVMPWAFMMEETINSTTHELFGVEYNPNRTHISGKHNFKQTFTTTVKQRVPASPYGFGVTWDGFTQRQLALLAAAGIQRA